MSAAFEKAVDRDAHIPEKLAASAQGECGFLRVVVGYEKSAGLDQPGGFPKDLGHVIAMMQG